MALTSSFSNNGAIPKQNSTSLYGGKSASVSVGGLKPTPIPPQSGAINLGAGSSPTMKLGTTPGLISQAKPTTPVKSITDTQGNKVEYHAPATPATKSTTQSAPKPEPIQSTPSYQEVQDPYANMGSNSSNTGSANWQPTPVPSVSAQNFSQASGPYMPPSQGLSGVAQGGLIGNLVAQSQQPSQAYLDAQAEAKRVSDQQTALAKDYAQKTKNIEGTAGFLTQASGLEGLLQNQYNTGQNALSQQYAGATSRLSAANAQQGLQVQAGQAAAGLNQPVSQFGMLTNPVTGQIVGGQGATASGVMQSALQNTLKMIKDGTTSFQDAYNTGGLAAFGVLGQTALMNALNGGGNTFSPTTQNTQVSANQSNLADTQKQAYFLNQNLGQIEKLEPVLTNFLQTSGLNPFDTQAANIPVQTYLEKVGNAQATKQWAAEMADLKNYTSQILASGYAGTPTGVESSTLNQDPSTLSYSQLKGYLQTLKDLGGNRLATLQENISSLGGNGVGFTGSPAQVVTSTTPAPPGIGIQNPTGQVIAGAGLGVADKILGLGAQIIAKLGL